MTDFLAAESGVRQLHARYVDAVFRKDAQAFVDCFAEDGEWKIAGMHLRGRAEIADAFEKFMAPTERILMQFGLPVLEVGQGAAIGRTYVTELVKHAAAPAAVRTIGVYYERFVEQGDRWRFQWRHWNLYYYGPPDLSAPMHAPPEYGAFPGMPGADEPTVVRRS
jgi:ketosteroid isomerase-like protein